MFFTTKTSSVYVVCCVTDVAAYATEEQKNQKQEDDDRLSRYYECLNIWVCVKTSYYDTFPSIVVFNYNRTELN